MGIGDIIREKYGINLPIRGGSGREIEDPIVLELTDENNIIGIKYAVLIIIGVINDFDWKPIGQTLHLLDNKKVDQIDIQISDENDSESFRIEEFYFEITECFDRFSKNVGEYLAKRN